MSTALLAHQLAVQLPQHTFLLVQEIVDENNYLQLTQNVGCLHTLCLGGNDKVRLIFSDEGPDVLSRKVFQGLSKESKAMLLLLSDSGLSPKSVMTAASACQ